MESRSEKFKSVNEEQMMSRSNRNQELYKNINNEDLDNITIKTNASVLKNDAYSIDIMQVRDMLDKKYRDELPKNIIEVPEKSKVTDVEYEKTREYDINEILNQARNENNNTNYNEERLRKLRDTQFDILKNLEIEKSKVTAPANEEEPGLMELINTITENELTHTEVDPLDILSDLRGTDESTRIINTININETNAPKVESPSLTNTQKLSDSIEFKKNDFDDFDDLKESKGNKVILNMVLIFLLIGFLVGLVALLNNLFEWGLF